MEILELADSLEILDLSNNRLHTLPETFGRLKKLKILFCNNNDFETFPAVLATCPALSMASFKGNKITTVDVLSPTIRWLILTNNQIQKLPAAIGKLSTLQKLMLAGNQLQSLPDEMAACQNLELIRLSANRLQKLPEWLFTLPRLSWLAYAGNPCCDADTLAIEVKSMRSLPTIKATELKLDDILGEGASGVIYKGCGLNLQGHQPNLNPHSLKTWRSSYSREKSPAMDRPWMKCGLVSRRVSIPI
ncbi:MAG: leucine-rich repeat domain-containing protein [Cyanobacteria bacterium P01_A01_bin.123]